MTTAPTPKCDGSREGDQPTPADAADALALAICHCWRAPMIARMAEAEAKAAEQRKKFAAKVRAAT